MFVYLFQGTSASFSNEFVIHRISVHATHLGQIHKRIDTDIF